MAAPTPQVFDDVQGGAPGEALHRPQLQLAQVTRQGLQLIGAPLPPVEKHVETRGVPCLARTLRSWVAPGASVPEARTQRVPGCQRAAETTGTGFGPAVMALLGEGEEHSGSGQGPYIRPMARAPAPHKAPFFPSYRHFTNFAFPAPSEPPPRRWAVRLGMQRPGEKKCNCFLVSLLR